MRRRSFTTGGAGRGALLAFVYSVGPGLPFLIAALGFAVRWAPSGSPAARRGP